MVLPRGSAATRLRAADSVTCSVPRDDMAAVGDVCVLIGYGAVQDLVDAAL